MQKKNSDTNRIHKHCLKLLKCSKKWNISGDFLTLWNSVGEEVHFSYFWWQLRRVSPFPNYSNSQIPSTPHCGKIQIFVQKFNFHGFSSDIEFDFLRKKWIYSEVDFLNKKLYFATVWLPWGVGMLGLMTSRSTFTSQNYYKCMECPCPPLLGTPLYFYFQHSIRPAVRPSNCCPSRVVNVVKLLSTHFALLLSYFLLA